MIALRRCFARSDQGSLDDDKAEDLVVIDLAGKSTLGDYMVVASGRSQRQVAAMADHLVFKLKQSKWPTPSSRAKPRATGC